MLNVFGAGQDFFQVNVTGRIQQVRLSRVEVESQLLREHVVNEAIKLIIHTEVKGVGVQVLPACL